LDLPHAIHRHSAVFYPNTPVLVSWQRRWRLFSFVLAVGFLGCRRFSVWDLGCRRWETISSGDGLAEPGSKWRPGDGDTMAHLHFFMGCCCCFLMDCLRLSSFSCGFWIDSWGFSSAAVVVVAAGGAGVAGVAVMDPFPVIFDGIKTHQDAVMTMTMMMMRRRMMLMMMEMNVVVVAASVASVAGAAIIEWN